MSQDFSMRDQSSRWLCDQGWQLRLPHELGAELRNSSLWYRSIPPAGQGSPQVLEKGTISILLPLAN